MSKTLKVRTKTVIDEMTEWLKIEELTKSERFEMWIKNSGDYRVMGPFEIIERWQRMLLGVDDATDNRCVHSDAGAGDDSKDHK